MCIKWKQRIPKKKTNMFESWMNNGNMDLIFLSK